MTNLFEYGDIINKPVECFYFDSTKECYPVHSHWHFYVEIIYMLEGTAQMTAGNIEYTVREQDMMLFHPQTVHMIRSDAPVKYAVLKFDLSVVGNFSSKALKFRNVFRSAKAHQMPVFFPAEQTAAIQAEAIFCRCISEMQTQGYGYHQLVRTKLSELLIEIVRIWNSQGFVIDNTAYASEDYDIYSITEYIDKNLHTNIQVTEIAKACGMSYSYFAKKFPAVYGKTCKEYMEEMRLFKVEEYLLFTDFDLNYIAQETGFSDCSYMIKSFKKHRGITPKKFRDGR